MQATNTLSNAKATIFGGRTRFYAFVTTYILACIGSTTSLAIISNELLVIEPVNPMIISAAYRSFCISFALAIFIFLTASLFAMTKFSRMIEDTIRASATFASQAQSIQMDEMKKLAKRFKTGRNIAANSLPGGVLVWILQATFLPSFWFMCLLQHLNAISCCFALWYAITSLDRARNRVRDLRCLRFNGGFCRETVFYSCNKSNRVNQTKTEFEPTTAVAVQMTPSITPAALDRIAPTLDSSA
jgi:hypothetical protein